jgi:tripartite-type tricarboxylate transporter receptor subunit TctC
MRLRTITMAAACVLAAGLAKPAAAQNYPNQSIKMIISFGAGGGSDIVGRIVAQRMQEKLGQPVVVENRPGAGGLLGNEAVASAPKDGYTLGVQTAGQIITPVMTKVVRFQPVDSFEWIGEIAVAGLLIVVRPDYPYQDIKSLVAAAKAEPGKIVFGSPGFGATQHLAAELFKQVAGVNMLHVPYRTTPEATTALLSKNTDVLFDTVTALLGQVQSGQLRALAVTSKDRDPAVPDVPTVAESGVAPNYDVTTWYGLYGPKGMPKPVLAKLNKVLNEILEEPETKSRLTKTGVIVKGSTPEAWAEFVAAEYKKWSAVREKAGLEQR